MGGIEAQPRSGNMKNRYKRVLITQPLYSVHKTLLQFLLAMLEPRLIQVMLFLHMSIHDKLPVENLSSWKCCIKCCVLLQARHTMYEFLHVYCVWYWCLKLSERLLFFGSTSISKGIQTQSLRSIALHSRQVQSVSYENATLYTYPIELSPDHIREIRLWHKDSAICRTTLRKGTHASQLRQSIRT
jgi:hypothetical protein